MGRNIDEEGSCAIDARGGFLFSRTNLLQVFPHSSPPQLSVLPKENVNGGVFAGANL